MVLTVKVNLFNFYLSGGTLFLWTDLVHTLTKLCVALNRKIE